MALTAELSRSNCPWKHFPPLLQPWNLPFQVTTSPSAWVPACPPSTRSSYLPAETEGNYNSIQPCTFTSGSCGSKQRTTPVFSTLLPKTCLPDDWLLSCLTAQLPHVIFALCCNDQDFLKLESSQSVSQDLFQVSWPRHMTLTQSDEGPKAPLSTHLKACHSQFYPKACLPFRIPSLRLVMAAGRWSKSLSVSHFKHTSFRSKEPDTAAWSGQIKPCWAAVLVVSSWYQDKISSTSHFDVIKVTDLGLWRSNQSLNKKPTTALRYRLDVPFPIGN